MSDTSNPINHSSSTNLRKNCEANEICTFLPVMLLPEEPCWEGTQIIVSDCPLSMLPSTGNLAKMNTLIVRLKCVCRVKLPGKAIKRGKEKAKPTAETRTAPA